MNPFYIESVLDKNSILTKSRGNYRLLHFAAALKEGLRRLSLQWGHRRFRFYLECAVSEHRSPGEHLISSNDDGHETTRHKNE